jgi:TolB protein
MDENSTEAQLAEQEPSRLAILAVNWRSCLLLTVMLLGLLATPLAVFYRWTANRSENQLADLFSQEGGVNRIAYITPTGQLATMSPDGSDVRLLSDQATVFEFPAWAPDGEQLAVIGGDKLLLLDVNGDTRGDDATVLYDGTEEAPFYLYWSPDSRHVGFLTSHADGIAFRLAESRTSEQESNLIAVGQPFYWDWTPAADQLFIHSGGSGPNAKLEMVDLQGVATSDEFGTAGIFQAPGISSSGRFKAFAALDAAGQSRLMIQSSINEGQQLEAHFGQLALTWSPVAETLAYKIPRIDGRLNGGPLRLIDATTNDVVLLSDDNVLAFFWSPDGQKIAYFSLPKGDNGSVRVSAPTDDRTLRSRLVRQQGDVGMELWVINVESGRQRRLLQFVPSPVFLRQFLPFFDQYALSHRIWSPDSDAIVIPVIEEGKSQIAVVPTDRGSARLVADGISAFWSQQ